MPSWKSLAVAFWIYAALPLCAQSAAKPDVEARIHRIEADVVDMPMGEKKPPLRLDLRKLMRSL